MKKLITLTAALLMMIAVQAQEQNKKNTYIENGDLIEATLRYDSGEISQTGFYTKDGKRTGEWVSFDRSGNKTAEAQYNDDQKVGTWFFWNEDKLTEVRYSNSSIAEVSVWEYKGTRVVSSNK